MESPIRSAGLLHAAGLRPDGTVEVWGYTGYDPTNAPAGVRFTQLDSGWYNNCGIATNDALHCWGLNTGPILNPPTGAYDQVAVGDSFACALRQSDQAVVCWGGDAYGAISQAPAGAFVDVASGGRHACAVRSNGALACWGENTFNKATPPSGTTYVDVTVGDNHSCAMRSNGTLACWGDNTSGQASPP